MLLIYPHEEKIQQQINHRSVSLHNKYVNVYFPWLGIKMVNIMYHRREILESGLETSLETNVAVGPLEIMVSCKIEL